MFTKVVCLLLLMERLGNQHTPRVVTVSGNMSSQIRQTKEDINPWYLDLFFISYFSFLYLFGTI